MKVWMLIFVSILSYGCRSARTEDAKLESISSSKGTAVNLRQGISPFCVVDSDNDYSRESSSGRSGLGLSASEKKRFCWPSPEENMSRDFDKLGVSMSHYATLVGTCLKRKPANLGEEIWCSSRIGRFGRIKESFRRSGLKEMCTTVIKEFVDPSYPNSDFCQYGNCGEGALIGVCLALRADFKTNEIRHCISENDHAFSMVYRDASEKWCILDRWDVAGKGYFFCNADWDDRARIIVIGGYPSTNAWYQRVTCNNVDKIF